MRRSGYGGEEREERGNEGKRRDAKFKDAGRMTPLYCALHVQSKQTGTYWTKNQDVIYWTAEEHHPFFDDQTYKKYIYLAFVIKISEYENDVRETWRY